MECEENCEKKRVRRRTVFSYFEQIIKIYYQLSFNLCTLSYFKDHNHVATFQQRLHRMMRHNFQVRSSCKIDNINAQHFNGGARQKKRRNTLNQKYKLPCLTSSIPFLPMPRKYCECVCLFTQLTSFQRIVTGHKISHIQ